MEITWIVISDASRARMFQQSSIIQQLTPIGELDHPQSRAKNHDLVTDQNGRSQNSSVKSYSVTMEPHSSPKAVEAEHFAREIAARLEHGLDGGKYTRLILAAPPHFLGLLRGCLSDRVAGKVALSIDKDLTQIPAQQIAERLQAMQ